MSFAVDIATGPRPGELTPRNVFVPPWYKPHENLDVEVVGTTGKRLGFSVAEVVAERRWAIGPDGHCMKQPDFEKMLLDWRKGQFEWQVPPKRTPDLMFEPIPSVEGFVSRGEDPADRRRTIDLSPSTPRLGLLRKREPIVDESLTKDPRWKPAPAEEKADPRDELLAQMREEIERLKAQAAPVAVKPEPKARKAVEKIPCPDCGAEVGGQNGLRLHRKHKHKETA